MHRCAARVIAYSIVVHLSCRASQDEDIHVVDSDKTFLLQTISARAEFENVLQQDFPQAPNDRKLRIGDDVLLVSNGLDIKPPSTKPLNIKRPVVIDGSTSYSQWAQDKILAPILTQIHNGFFVESGAFDGEGMSNSIYYEIRGWTGLLVEPDPGLFEALMTKNRKAFAFQGAVSPTTQPEVLNFTKAGALGHLDVHAQEEQHIMVNAQPLSTLLQALNPPRTTVDFWSLDVEGNEGTVLKATDFSKIEVGLLLVEINSSEENKKQVQEVMKENGFVDIGFTRCLTPACSKDGVLDHIFVNPKYFKARNLEVPTHVKDISEY